MQRMGVTSILFFVNLSENGKSPTYEEGRMKDLAGQKSLFFGRDDFSDGKEINSQAVSVRGKKYNETGAPSG